MSGQQEFVAAIDCGTTSSRFMVFDSVANVIAFHQIEFDQLYPQPGWHEHRPVDLVTSVQQCIEGTVGKLEKLGHKASQIKVIGITNQRETTVVWDKRNGQPLYNAIVWDDARTASTVHHLSEKTALGGKACWNETGMPIATYFSGVKLRWMLDNVEEVRKAHDEGYLAFGTVDTWLLYNFTGGASNGGVFVTDVTNASRTLFFNINNTAWSSTLLSFFGVKEECLPEIVSSSEVYGEMKEGPLKGIRIAGIAGDQQAALVGNKCLTTGMAKNTYGTGCFMLFNTGADIVLSTHGLISTVAYQAGRHNKPVYALEGSIAVAGSAIKWLRDNLNLFQESADVGKLAGEVKDSSGVYFVTAFGGLFAPYWDDTATGTIVGLTSYTTKQHIARATLEASCFQTRAILEAMYKDSGVSLKVLKVDGGMTNSDVCMQIQADILGIDVERPEMRESTALGSAILAASAVGLFGWDVSKPETLEKVNTAGQQIFKPVMSEKEREKNYDGWRKAVERSKGWHAML